MTLASSIALFGSLVVFAFIPGPGILAVVARTMAGNIRHGLSTSAGLVAGDCVYITVALLGLSALADVMGTFFALVKYVGAAYLIWLGVSLALSRGTSDKVELKDSPSHWASFSAGLVTTLSNPKAILFYLSFFPAFLDLSTLSALEIGIVYMMATVAVGSVLAGYAYAVQKAKNSPRLTKGSPLLRYGSGALLVGSGVFVAAQG